MAGPARSPLALLLLLILAFAAAGAQARLLRGGPGAADQPGLPAPHGAPRGLLGAESKAADARDWPAQRQVASSSGRGSSSFSSPAAASSRSYSYTTSAQPTRAAGGMSAPIYDSAWANRG